MLVALLQPARPGLRLLAGQHRRRHVDARADHTAHAAVGMPPRADGEVDVEVPVGAVAGGEAGPPLLAGHRLARAIDLLIGLEPELADQVGEGVPQRATGGLPPVDHGSQGRVHPDDAQLWPLADQDQVGDLVDRRGDRRRFAERGDRIVRHAPCFLRFRTCTQSSRPVTLRRAGGGSVPGFGGARISYRAGNVLFGKWSIVSVAAEGLTASLSGGPWGQAVMIVQRHLSEQATSDPGGRAPDFRCDVQDELSSRPVVLVSGEVDLDTASGLSSAVVRLLDRSDPPTVLVVDSVAGDLLRGGRDQRPGGGRPDGRVPRCRAAAARAVGRGAQGARRHRLRRTCSTAFPRGPAVPPRKRVDPAVVNRRAGCDPIRRPAAAPTGRSRSPRASRTR